MTGLPSPLLGVTERRGAGEALVDTVRSILDGGARWIWFRERDMPVEARTVLAGEVLTVVRRYGGRLSIGGDAGLAARIGADGVHLAGGAGPTEIAAARAILPSGLIGLSAHSPHEIAEASRVGVDYATLSPIFATASKPGYGPALGLAALTEAAAFGIPVIALGGVTIDRVRGCRKAGAAGVAVMGGLMRGRDPCGTARALLASLKSIVPPA